MEKDTSVLLELIDVDTYYGRAQALQGISLQVGQGEIVAILGANGAGKSTTLLTISGILRPGGERSSIRASRSTGKSLA